MPAKGIAEWRGDLATGSGSFTAGDTISGGYTYRSRFEDGPGSSPEQLIAAAHAACFSMAFGAQMGQREIVPQSVTTTSAITMENLTLTKSALTTTVVAPGADKAKIEEAAAAAKAGCPISKVLNLEITLDLTINV